MYLHSKTTENNKKNPTNPITFKKETTYKREINYL